MSDVKIVVNFKDNVALIGVGKPDSDPALFRAEGDLSTVLKGLPALVKAAEGAWANSARYPVTDWKPPAPPPRPSVPARQPKEKPKPKELQLEQGSML